eukprot:5595206-Lingulodinium_polyedra.AAC.1
MVACPQQHTAGCSVNAHLPRRFNRAGLLVDTGVRGNLSGDAWVQVQALLSKKAGYMPSQSKLDTPLQVQGVGSGAQ